MRKFLDNFEKLNTFLVFSTDIQLNLPGNFWHENYYFSFEKGENSGNETNNIFPVKTRQCCSAAVVDETAAFSGIFVFVVDFDDGLARRNRTGSGGALLDGAALLVAVLLLVEPRPLGVDPLVGIVGRAGVGTRSTRG